MDAGALIGVVALAGIVAGCAVIVLRYLASPRADQVEVAAELRRLAGASELVSSSVMDAHETRVALGAGMGGPYDLGSARLGTMALTPDGVRVVFSSPFDRWARDDLIPWFALRSVEEAMVTVVHARPLQLFDLRERHEPGLVLEVAHDGGVYELPLVPAERARFFAESVSADRRAHLRDAICERIRASA